MTRAIAAAADVSRETLEIIRGLWVLAALVIVPLDTPRHRARVAAVIARVELDHPAGSPD